MRHLVLEMASRHTLVNYDCRGVGLSQREVADMSYEAWIRDLQAVVDAAGLERFALWGTSGAPAVAIGYAVRHPERVSRLVLCGGFCRGRLRRDGSAATIEKARCRWAAARSGCCRRGARRWRRCSNGSRPATRLARSMASCAWWRGPDIAQHSPVRCRAPSIKARPDTFFQQELPAIQQWQFTPEQAKRITQPVLAVLGEHSGKVSPIWTERQQLLLSALPRVEGFVLPGTTHLPHVENSRGMAEALAAFFARHPMAASR